MLSWENDIELWDSYAQGNKEALGVLFKRYYALLYQYGNKICKDEATLEDCIQELFADLWQKKSQQPIQSVKAYLLQALKYKLYKSFRDKTATSSVDDDTSGHFELSHESFLINRHDDDEKIKMIVNAINQLPARQKEIIYLKIYKGLSYEEISEIMQINYQVVRNLLCQALKTFRKLIIPATILFTVLSS
ncbi:MAG TPA: sigma-70 family RNA polymerase sigma factor [Flavisolibacter sp.]|nr:sigma-70 family RNA polymerase sigma factor [Flavisolibacter sp.]